jgi:hypothetical protein
MTSPKLIPPNNDVHSKLDKIGLRAISLNLDDFLARATIGRRSPPMIIEQLSEIESEDRSLRTLEHRSSLSGI